MKDKRNEKQVKNCISQRPGQRMTKILSKNDGKIHQLRVPLSAAETTNDSSSPMLRVWLDLADNQEVPNPTCNLAAPRPFRFISGEGRFMLHKRSDYSLASVKKQMIYNKLIKNIFIKMSSVERGAKIYAN